MLGTQSWKKRREKKPRRRLSRYLWQTVLKKSFIRLSGQCLTYSCSMRRQNLLKTITKHLTCILNWVHHQKNSWIKQLFIQLKKNYDNSKNEINYKIIIDYLTKLVYHSWNRILDKPYHLLHKREKKQKRIFYDWNREDWERCPFILANDTTVLKAKDYFWDKFEIVTLDFSRLKGGTVLYHHGV